jgi:hypothetical protein
MDKMRGREPAPDYGARRIAHYERVFERPRQSHLPINKDLGETDAEKGLLLSPSGVKLETPAWLEVPGRNRREKSEALEVQIEKELERRGYGSRTCILIFFRPAYGSPQKISRVVDILVRLTKRTALPAISLSAHGGVARTAAFLSLVESLKTSNG